MNLKVKRVSSLHKAKVHRSGLSVRITSSDGEEVNHEDPLGFLKSKTGKLLTLTFEKSKPKAYMEKERVRVSVSPEWGLKRHSKTTKTFENHIFISYL